MWTEITIEDSGEYCEWRRMEKLAMSAVDRSCSRLVSFSIAYFATDGLLVYVADRSSGLRCLRLSCCDSVKRISDAVKKLPRLEGTRTHSLVNHHRRDQRSGQWLLLAQNSSLLRTFKLNYREAFIYDDEDEEAFASAKAMPQLRPLQIIGNSLTDAGLNAVLDGCPHLEFLDLRSCSGINIYGI